MAAVGEVATIKDSLPNKRFIGDVFNGLVVVNTLVYIGFIAAKANGKFVSLRDAGRFWNPGGWGEQ
jgi:hypothetical protein